MASEAAWSKNTIVLTMYSKTTIALFNKFVTTSIIKQMDHIQNKGIPYAIFKSQTKVYVLTLG